MSTMLNHPLIICRMLSPPNPAIASLKMLLDVLQLDHLPLGWRYKPKKSTPELVPEFNKTISPPVRSICREWCNIALRFPSRDPDILTIFTRIIPVLPHWVAAMGIMGELDSALRGLCDLHDWAVRPLQFTRYITYSTCNIGGPFAKGASKWHLPYNTSITRGNYCLSPFPFGWLPSFRARERSAIDFP